MQTNDYCRGSRSVTALLFTCFIENELISIIIEKSSILKMVRIMKEKEIVLKLYQNADMGIIGIESIEEKIESRNLSKVILNQKEEYQKIKNELIPLCKKYEVENKDLGTFVKINSDVMANMKTMMDHTDSHIAKMMMEGTNKGLIELEELINHYEGNDQKITEMIQKVIDIEHKNYEELKIYL